jgi:heme/copper-type cytochrome/quinol oxidase subunit 3
VAATPSEPLPSGLSGGPSSRGLPIDEPADVRRQRGARALSLGARLGAGATTFFFLAFVFAYFYLRSLNQNHFWLPSAALLKEQKEVHVNLTPNQGLGAAFVACLVISVALTLLAGQRNKRDSPNWIAPAIGGLVFGLAAIALQCVEYTVQHFGPTDGAFASVFCAWTGFYLLAVLGTMVWLEIQVATELSERRDPTLERVGSAAYHDPLQLLPRGFDATVFYWAYLGGIGVIMYVVLYLL